ncbi:MAG: hypothetical protein OXE17_09745 [Chloroflexi bacterium]|nr:hypothetical protein [Chloroflexota bacterium]
MNKQDRFRRQILRAIEDFEGDLYIAGDLSYSHSAYMFFDPFMDEFLKIVKDVDISLQWAYSSLGRMTGQHIEILDESETVSERQIPEKDAILEWARIYYLVITSEGYELLDELEHPARNWISQNWFPLAVAISALVVSVGSVVINLLG